MGEGIETEPPVAGMAFDAAVETVVKDDPSIDVSTARALLQPVSKDGRVTREAVAEELANLSKVVSTPETRTELAGVALEEARVAAATAPDMDIVNARLADFEDRLSAIKTAVQSLAEELQVAVESDRESDPIIDIAKGIHDVRDQANTLQQAADELQVELESFEQWLEDPSRRIDELTEDIDVVAGTLQGLEETLDELGAREEIQDGEQWVECWISYLVTGLLLDDIKAEFDQLREWHHREAVDQLGGMTEAEDRITALEATRNTIHDRLESLARPDWRERYRDRVDAVESTLSCFEPPVEWDEVQVALDEART